jgi:CheY-like chemotaxis protein
MKHKQLSPADYRYIDGLIHDIRQPMLSLEINVSRLLEEAPQTPLEPVARNIASAVKEQTVLIGELMRALGYELNQDAAVSSDLREASLQQLLAPLRMMNAQSPDFSINLDVADVRLFTKPADIYRIVSNLVLNALRHSHGRRIDVTAEADSKGLSIRVIDDGRGFPAGREQMILRWSYDPASRPGKDISGTGLPSCLSLAEALGGRLVLEAASKAGTTWLLSLPGVVINQQPPPEGFGANELEGAVVAVLDDQGSAADSISQRFQSVGATVVVANDELELLRRVHRHEPRPALYVLDYVLGESVYLGRALDTLASIDGALSRVVVHTAHPHMARSVADRVAGVVPKPMQDRHFRAMVDFASGRVVPLQWALREADAALAP